jgi:class 3 adenylate cyclase
VGAKTIEQYEADIARLQAENERLKSQGALALMGTICAVPRGKSSTISGLDEMVLQVGLDDTVGYVNLPMARLLGIGDRKAALGTPLAQWDSGSLGDRVLQSLVQLARGAEEPRIVERSCPGLPPELLPGSPESQPKGDPVLSFAVSSTQGRVQIIAQDVSKLRWLEATFARYLSPKVIEQMRGLPVDSLLSMERREISVLFTDLRGFTALCQQEEPEQVRDTVNSFLSSMVECVERLDGTVQGFAGDEVMALFGAPVEQPDHALRALVCATEMQKAHHRSVQDRTAQGKPSRPAGIGLATGAVVVGNIGTASRINYTAQGHAVNLAARLCASAAGGEVLTIPATHTAALAAAKVYRGDVPLPRLHFEPKGQMTFKNVSAPVHVLSVMVKG